MKIDEQSVDQLFSDYKKTYGGVRNDYFAPAYLAAEHQLEVDQALLQTTFGGCDYGFDAFHFDKETGNLYLYQFKWSEDATLFKDCYGRMIDAGLERIFTGSYQDPKQNQALIQIKSLLLERKHWSTASLSASSSKAIRRTRKTARFYRNSKRT